MIDITFKTGVKSQSNFKHSYRIAQQSIFVNQPLAVLQSFADESSVELPQSGAATALMNREPSQLIYHGPGWLGNEWREVECWTVEGGFRITVAGIGSNWLTADGRSIVIAPEPGVGEELVVEVALGPPLILSLALHDTWCLHGSAVAIDNKAALFLGESGKGKSTLARWLDRNSEQNLRRIGDDILPVTSSDGHLYFMPHFPQLKMPPDEQPALGLPQRLPVTAVYTLTRPADYDGIEIKDLGTQDGALALVRHTVASRLFDADLLAKQFDFCVRAAGDMPLKELSYPLTREAMPEIYRALSLDLQPSTKGQRVD